MATAYEEEFLSENIDRGDMPRSREELAEAVVGHRIVSAECKEAQFVITLDTGRVVSLVGTDDCCAYTELEEFLLHTDMIDHVIMGVGTTDQYETWHVYADLGDVLELKVGWSAGNTGYYGYGFGIKVTNA
jgi:hypothetical protein